MIRQVFVASLFIFAFSICPLPAQDDLKEVSLDDQLIIAADKGDSISVLACLNRGADANAKTYEGVTALMYAAQSGYTQIAGILIKNGARPDLKTPDGYTALLLSILNGYIETAEFIIRHGADKNLGDNEGVTPLMHAVAVDSFFMPDMLLYYGANADLKDSKGRNALMIAAKAGHYEIAISLLDAGVNINDADHEGNTALHYATASAQTELMELLIANGASVDVKNGKGYTPLAVAVASDNYRTCRLLIGYGAEVNTRVDQSTNLLTLAGDNKNDSIRKLLINNEAKQIQRPNFNKFTIGSGLTFNNKDSHTEIALGLSDSRYHLMPLVSYSFRTKPIRVLEMTDTSTYYQFWEKRHFISMSLEKAFFLRHIGSSLTTGAFAGIGGVLTFGSYKGSANKPETQLLFQPRIGCMVEYKFVRMKMSYEFMDLHLRNYDNSWLSLSFDIMFKTKKGSYTIQ